MVSTDSLQRNNPGGKRIGVVKTREQSTPVPLAGRKGLSDVGYGGRLAQMHRSQTRRTSNVLNSNALRLINTTVAGDCSLHRVSKPIGSVQGRPTEYYRLKCGNIVDLKEGLVRTPDTEA